MKIVDIPVKFPIPFAVDAGSLKRQVPTDSQIGITDGAASLQTGYPPDNFIQQSAGGIGPFGQDVNGLAFQTTGWARWFSAGGPVRWDSAFANDPDVGGYPAGAVVADPTVLGRFYVSLVDDNLDDPTDFGANWKAFSYFFNPVGQCYFQYVSTTQVKLVPKNGNTVTVNGVPRQIPAVGITANVGSCYVNGVAARALAISTGYNVYLTDVSGTLVLDFWSGTGSGHIPDTAANNIGVEVRNDSGTPDSTRTLVGKVGTNASAQLFTGQGASVISWFNQRPISLASASPASRGGITQQTPQLLNDVATVTFLNWGDTSVGVGVGGQFHGDQTGSSAYLVACVDSLSTPAQSGFYSSTNDLASYVPCFVEANIAEGFHGAFPCGFVDVGVTGTYSGCRANVRVNG